MSPTHLMSLSPRISPRAARRIASACGAGVLLFGAAACGSSNDPSTPTNAAQNGGPESSNQGAGTDQQGRFPGANGKVAAVVDKTAQVQGNDGQVAVTWNGSTTFTKQVSATLADVKVGSCVMVQPAEDSSTSSSTDTTKVTAGTVRITEKASDGTCTAGFGGGGRPTFNGNGGGSTGGQPPAGGANSEGGQPPPGSTGKGPRIRGGFGAFGEVTAVSATGFTVKSIVPQGNPNGASSGSTPSTTEQSVTVTVSKATTYTTTGKGAASDVKVGSCLRAQGTTDSTGAVTAKTVELSAAVDGECGVATFRRDSGAGAPDKES